MDHSLPPPSLPFRNRQAAAQLLVAALADLRGTHPLVLGIPRGAVPMAAVIAEALGGDLDVVLVRKLGAPPNPEFAIGWVGEGGAVHLDPSAARMGLGERELDALVASQREVLRVRRERYAAARPPLDPAGRTVVVVDDGVATGATLESALQAVRAHGPSRLTAAVPVASPDGLQRVARYADAVVCLAVVEDFQAVGQFYSDFHQVTDDEVITLLEVSHTHRLVRPATPSCPSCSSLDVASILYGKPVSSEQLQRQIDAGHIVLGGCSVEEGSPSWHCNTCEHRWGPLRA